MKHLSHILITAGPTREKLDSVRFISNFSTGNMGYELAEAALKKGYKVTLISGPTELTPPKGVNFVKIEDARQMEKAVKRNFKRADCLFMASAVCDWRPKKAARGKIKKGPKRLSIELIENPDILGRIGGDKGGRLLVGFALESKELIKNATAKLKRKRLDLIVANRVGSKRSPFGAGETDVTFIEKGGKRERIFNISKSAVAAEALKRAERLWRERR